MKQNIKLIIGLGNPGRSYYYQRHSIGFRVLDALADKHAAHWHKKNNMEYAEISLHGTTTFLVKPQTYMNSSGEVLPYFKKQGMTPDQMLVVHDELELPFGKLACKTGGSAKGHNGLKSIIAVLGSDTFHRLRFGIGRPANKEQVPDYVLENFSEQPAEIDKLIEQAVAILENGN